MFFTEPKDVKKIQSKILGLVVISDSFVQNIGLFCAGRIVVINACCDCRPDSYIYHCDETRFIRRLPFVKSIRLGRELFELDILTIPGSGLDEQQRSSGTPYCGVRSRLGGARIAGRGRLGTLANAHGSPAPSSRA
jgi:hypothetical protein